MDWADFVLAVLNAPDLAGLRALVEDTPELFGEDMSRALDEVAANARIEVDHDVADHATGVAALLGRCRLVGTAEAFAEAAGRPTGVDETWAAAIAARTTGDAHDAESLWHRLLALLPEFDGQPAPLARTDALSALGALSLDRFTSSGNERDIDEAVRLLDLAARQAAVGVAAEHHNNLAAGLMARYDVRGDPVDMTDAITAFATAANNPTVSSSARTIALSGWGSALLTRYATFGDESDLDAAIEHLEASLADENLVQADGAFRGNLGLGLLSRYEVCGDVEDLRRAIGMLRSAVNQLPSDSSDWCGAMANLGNALLQSYQLNGAGDVLDEAVFTIERAIAGAANVVDLPGFHNTLGGCLLEGFNRTGEIDQLDRAVDAFQQAVDGIPAEAPELAIYLDSLASGRRERFVRRGDVSDIKAAIEAAERAVAATGPTAAERPRRLATLGNCLATYPATANSDERVDRIVTCYAEAVRLSPAEAPERWVHITNMASGLLDRYEHRRNPADLDAAVRWYREALSVVPTEAQGTPSLHYNMAVALDLRHEVSGNNDDRTAALVEFEAAARLAAPDSPDVALLAGKELGSRWARSGNWAQSADGYAVAIRAMLRLVRRQMVRADSEIRLRETGQLPTDAALATARAGRTRTAVTVLDQGRALLLSLVLERESIDLSRLRAEGNGELADRYQRAATLVGNLELGTPENQRGIGPRPRLASPSVIRRNRPNWTVAEGSGAPGEARGGVAGR